MLLRVLPHRDGQRQRQRVPNDTQTCICTGCKPSYVLRFEDEAPRGRDREENAEERCLPCFASCCSLLSHRLVCCLHWRCRRKRKRTMFAMSTGMRIACSITIRAGPVG